jgi:hypothetical protein
MLWAATTLTPEALARSPGGGPTVPLSLPLLLDEVLPEELEELEELEPEEDEVEELEPELEEPVLDVDEPEEVDEPEVPDELELELVEEAELPEEDVPDELPELLEWEDVPELADVPELEPEPEPDDVEPASGPLLHEGCVPGEDEHATGIARRARPATAFRFRI